VFIVDPETLIEVARLDIPKPLIIVINKRGFSKLAKKEIYGISRPKFGIAVIFIKSILECSRSVSQFLLRFFVFPSLGSKIVRYMIDSGALISYLRLLSSSTD
jgi:hypothetical protein